MKALLKKTAGPGALLEEIDAPVAGPGELLLKIRATSICGTDRHIYEWNSWAQSALKPPLVFGHEFTGEIVEVGREVEGYRAGETVSVESHVPCGRCRQCAGNLRHICDHLAIIGIDRPGSFAEYVSIPAVCAWKVSPSMPVEIASIMEPLGNAVHAVSAARVPDKVIVVFGCGPTGLFAVAVAAAKGAARIIAVDPNVKRLGLAKAAGAHVVHDGSSQSLREVIRSETEGYGADRVLEMSGHPDAIREGLRSLKKGGTMVAFGLSSRAVEVDLSNEVILKGRNIVGVVGRRMFETWEEMQDLLDTGRLDPAPIITHRFPLVEFESAFATLTSGDAGKVVLFP